MAKSRTNVIPIIEDARHPLKYRMLIDMVDVVFADVAQPDQGKSISYNILLLKYNILLLKYNILLLKYNIFLLKYNIFVYKESRTHSTLTHSYPFSTYCCIKFTLFS